MSIKKLILLRLLLFEEFHHLHALHADHLHQVDPGRKVVDIN